MNKISKINKILLLIFLVLAILSIIYIIFREFKPKPKSKEEQQIECLKMGSDSARDECYRIYDLKPPDPESFEELLRRTK